MSTPPVAPRPCSIAAALGVIGEKYSLLVLREVFFGVRRFNDMARNIGAPRDVLTTRLNHLVDAGVLEKSLYHERPPRYEYVPTGAGRELQEVLLTLLRWGDRYLSDRPPVIFEHTCGEDFEAMVTCRACGEEVRSGTLTPHFQIDGWGESGRLE